MSDKARRPIDRERPWTRRAWLVLGILMTLTAAGVAALWMLGELPFEAASSAVVVTVVWWGAGLYGVEKMVGVASADLGESDFDAGAKTLPPPSSG